MNQSQQFLSRLLGWTIPIIAAVVITVLLAPTVAQRFNLPLPAWLPPAQNSVTQNSMSPAEQTIKPAQESAQEPEPAQIETESLPQNAQAWPTPPQRIMAASGNVTPIGTSPTPAPSPTRTPFPTPTIIALPTPVWHEMNYLTSIKLTASTVVNAERATSLPVLGDIGLGNITTDRLLFKAVGEILIGIDLSRISNVTINGKSIQLTMPPPEIMAVELLPQRSEIYLSSRTIFLSQYEGFETEALERARRQLRGETARNQGLIDLTKKTASLQLIEFLNSVGYDEVVLVEETAERSTVR